MSWEKEPEEEELNNPYSDHVYSDEAEEYDPPRRPLLFRLVAFFTVLAFIGLIAINYWPVLKAPIAELVLNSLHYKKDIDKQLLQAVVKIDVISRKNGSSLAVEQKSGTGFNIAAKGLIVTNYHVIGGDSINITVSFPNGDTYPAAHWSGKPEYDLALITLDKEKLPTVPLNMTKPPSPGDRVRIVGNPLGLNNIIVEGEVRQYLTIKGQKVFSIGAPIYPGNSGSPVYDGTGKVVGVVFGSLHSNADQSESDLGLAIPVTDILKFDAAL